MALLTLTVAHEAMLGKKAVKMCILRGSTGHDAGIGRYVLLMIGNGSRALVLSTWRIDYPYRAPPASARRAEGIPASVRLLGALVP